MCDTPRVSVCFNVKRTIIPHEPTFLHTTYKTFVIPTWVPHRPHTYLSVLPVCETRLLTQFYKSNTTSAMVASRPILHCTILIHLSLMNNLSFVLKEFTCHEAMNLVTSAFPLHHDTIFVKVSQFISHDFFKYQNRTYVKNKMAFGNGEYY